MEEVKGYKGFDKDFRCIGKQYAENSEYEEDGDHICGPGMMHFCETPLDVLDYYPILDNDCNFTRFAEVTAKGAVRSDGNKRAARKLKVGAELSFKDFIKAAVTVCIERVDEYPKTRSNNSKLAASGNNSKLAASGNNSKLAASGNNSKLAASGNNSKLAASGDDSKLAASGDDSKLAASGYDSKLAASGDYSKLAASGDDSKLAASGYDSKLAASGYDSKLAASGDYSKLAASGYYSQLAASGDYSKLAASGNYSQLAASGNYSKLAASGDDSKLAASGNYSQLAASGNYSKLAASGDCSVVAGIGINNIAKCALGGFIVLAEWRYLGDRFVPVNVKATKVDGETIKADTWYKLSDGEFMEVQV